MKIASISSFTAHEVRMDDGALFTRYGPENWTERMGDSDEPVYNPRADQLEAAFQQFPPVTEKGSPVGGETSEPETHQPETVVDLSGVPAGGNQQPMIAILKSATADTRTCDFASVTKETLLRSSYQHIDDVQRGLQFFIDYLDNAAERHDFDKIEDLDFFHEDFVTGFAKNAWWDHHRKINRHHLSQEDGVPEDVNLLDVLEYISDCVMAGAARSGLEKMYFSELPPELLQRAFKNTFELLKAQIEVVEHR